MDEFAAIGIKMPTDDLERGITKLEELSRQGPKVENSMKGIESGAKRVAKSLAELGVGSGAGLDKVGAAGQKAAAGVQAVGGATRKAVTDTDSLRQALSGLTSEEERFVRSLEKQYNAMSMGRGDFEAYIAAQKGMGTGAQEVARAMGNKIDALKAEQKALLSNSDAMAHVTSAAQKLALAFAGGAFYQKFISETIAAEQEQAQLAAVLKSTGEAAGWSQQKLNDMASAMSKNSIFSAGEINQAQTRLLSYSNVVGQQFPRAMQAVIDMSARMGMSVTQSAESIGKALDVPSEGLTALSKQGFRFTEAQKALVEQFEEVGKTAEAQKIILEAVEASYGGAAAAARDTLGGSLAGLKNTINDLMTGSGGSVEGLTSSINGLSESLASEATHQAFVSLTTWMTDATNVAVRLVNAMAMLGAGNIGGALLGGDKLSSPASALVEIESKIAEKQRQLDAFGVGGTGAMAWMKRGYNADDIAISNKQLAFFNQQREILLGMVNKSEYGDNAPDVDALTAALTKQNVVLGKSTEWIKAYGTAAEKADLAVKEWRKQLGDGLTADMEAQIRAGFKEKGAKGVGQQEKAISDIRARILAEEELIKRIQEHGAAAQGLSESDKLVGRLQEEIAGTTSKRTKANLEGQLAEALVWQETQKHRTELEKLAKTQDEGEKSYRKFIDSLFKSADAMGDMADKQNAANATFGKSKVAIAEMAAEQAKLAFLNAKDMGPWTPEQIAALKALTDQHDEYVKSLREAEFLSANRKYDDAIKAAKDELEIQKYSMSLLGEEDLKRNKLIAARKAEIKLAKELLEIEKQYKGRTDDESVKQRTELESKARIQAEEELQGELAKIQDQYINEQVSKYGDIFRQGFADFVNNGTDGLKAFGKSLKTTILTSAADALYKAFAQKFVMNVVANISGGGWIDSLLGLVGMAGGSGGGGSNVLGLANNAQTAYSIYNGTWGASLLGNSYAYGAFTPGLTMGSQQAAMLAAQTGEFGYAGLSATSQAAAGAGTGAGGAGGYAAVGWAAAAVIAAAYLGGMFKEEKQVGEGLTGDLGGDMYGYQLMRESGGLFDGPDYRYVVAEKELADAKARLAELQTGTPYAELGDKGAALREREMQMLYNQMDVLERNYRQAIDNSQGPIKVLQDAYTGMRENTAAKADSLGLDGDSIRAMKVALGVDEIHPDTGGKGLQLTGLTQEEASKKIQEALAQANEELARSVLGSWEEQTREVTRVIFDSVAMPSDGDTEVYGRVGREVKETITEQVFVMSEFVREGETAVQALDRMSGSLVGVNNVFELLGATLLDASLAGGDWASTLVDAIGGMDALTEAASSYFDLFYSDEEKRVRLAQQANKGMQDKGIDLRVEDNDAKAKYRDLVDKAMAAQDEAMLAWLLGFAQSFSTGVQAFTEGLDAAKQAADEAAQAAADALRAAQDLAMRNLEAAIGREKEYWNQFATDAKTALTKASSYFDLVTGSAASLRGSVADVATMQAAAGMVFIEQAVESARLGMGLSDYDKTKTAINAANTGLVMGNYATQAELDYDKKVLAGQLEELGGYAELAKSDAQKQIDRAETQIKMLDETLKFWQEYGKDQIDATLSVTDAIKQLEKLMFPEKDAATAGTGGTGGGGATFGGGGGYIIGGGGSDSLVAGYLPDGRIKYTDGSVSQNPASEAAPDKLVNGQDPFSGYPSGGGSGKVEWDEAKGLFVPKFDVGTNWIPRDMLAMVHQGERIIPAADNRALMNALQNQGSGPGNAELIAAVNRLEQRLAAIEGHAASTAQSTGSTNRTIADVTENGNGMRVAAMS